MENIFVILNTKEIELAKKMVGDMQSYKVYTHDPQLIDHIRLSGLANVEFFDWENCLELADLEKEAIRSVASLEAQLDITAQNIFPDISIRAWQYFSLLHVLLMLKWYSRMWKEIPITKAGKYHVFINDNPSSLNLSSYLPSVMLLELLNALGIELSAFSYGVRPADSALLPNLVGEQEAPCGLLTHIPTCVYDYLYFNEEIAATGKSVVNLESAFTNVPVFGSKSVGLTGTEELILTLPEDLQKKIDDFTSRISTDLSAFIGEFIKTPSYRDRQVQQIAKVYRSQIVCYFLLQRYFFRNKPAKMLVSDHDAGIHGPLISFAQVHRIPVVMLPHSKRTNNIPYIYENITCLSHPVQGEDISNGNGKLIPNFYLSYPEAFSGSTVFPRRIESICLILNELSSLGIYYTRIKPYFEGIRKIATWCTENGVVLSIRCKPSMPFITLLAEATGLEIQSLFDSMSVSMAEFTKGKDLCLMYDAPSSGILEFLRSAVPVLNPVPEQLSITESSTVHTSLVPRGSIQDILNQLDLFMADRANLLRFRNTQFSGYVNAFKDTYPLRFFL